ncbi:MAG: iron-only hydrogenase system regulator [Mycoplasmataceae bacterium]|jgi:putative iron-only hydrogenase system regulator|nr:iron-only hydrogenase system regulator [Mycoplasmataceae bacterium]
MKTNERIALIGIVVKDSEQVKHVNDLLHEYRQFIIGRMGIPHRKHDLCIISVAIETKQDDIATLSGKLGALKGISAKVLYAS